MKDDRGQALILAALLTGVSAVAVVGLAIVSEVILQDVRDERAGEAAVLAAGTGVSDILSAREAELGRALEPDEIAGIAADPAVHEIARSAAVRLAREHRRGDPTEVRVVALRYEVEVRVTLAGRQYVALLGSGT